LGRTLYSCLKQECHFYPLKWIEFEYCAVIKFFVKKGLMPNKIHSKFKNVYGDSSPSFSTTKKWAAEFKRGRTSLQDNPCEGHPKSATIQEIIEQVHDMELNEWQMDVHEIAETIGISKERVGYILHKKLDMKKLCARWLPLLLTADQNCTCMKFLNSAWSILTKIQPILSIDL
jgi:histone-lysine N-methyltransferase SETMAR